MTQNENKIVNDDFTPHPDDALYCQITFGRYKDHLQFVTTLADDVFARYQKHLAKHTSTAPYGVEFTETRDTVTTLRNVEIQLTKTFAHEIEEYFHTKYNLDFDPMVLIVDGKVSPLDSFQPIINNILRQIGHDFPGMAREQIKRRFQNEFTTDKSQPVLKGSVIQFPLFAAYYENQHPEPYINLQHACLSVSRHLLDAVNYFFNANLRQPETLTDMVECWRNKIDTDVWYIIQQDHNVSLKFFKNHRVNVMFKDAATAADFFEYFGLENIVKRHPHKK